MGRVAPCFQMLRSSERDRMLFLAAGCSIKSILSRREGELDESPPQSTIRAASTAKEPVRTRIRARMAEQVAEPVQAEPV